MNFFSNLNWGAWLYGLFAGAIGGGATAVYGALAVTMLDPKNFAFGGGNSLKLMGLMFGMSFLKDAALYLKQHPLPDVKTVTTTETVEHQEHPSATVTTTVEETKIGTAAK